MIETLMIACVLAWVTIIASHQYRLRRIERQLGMLRGFSIAIERKVAEIEAANRGIRSAIQVLNDDSPAATPDRIGENA
jgi:hypothetical protein